MTVLFSFETFLFTVFYYIKPNQLSQRQHAIIGSWVGIFKQSGLDAQIQTRCVRLQWGGRWSPVIETCNIMIANWLNIISRGFYFVCLLPLIKRFFFSLFRSRSTLCKDVWLVISLVRPTKIINRPIVQKCAAVAKWPPLLYCISDYAVNNSAVSMFNP